MGTCGVGPSSSSLRPGEERIVTAPWEALYMGCTVICLETPLAPLYDGLAVATVDTWDELFGGRRSWVPAGARRGATQRTGSPFGEPVGNAASGIYMGPARQPPFPTGEFERSRSGLYPRAT